jgi:hypothetical protein
MSFYGLTGSLLGIYEATAKLTGRTPTLTALAARTPARKTAAILWTLGLAHHFLTAPAITKPNTNG